MKSTALKKYNQANNNTVKNHIEKKIDKSDISIRYALFAYGGVTNHTAEWLAETSYKAGQMGIRFHSLSANSSACIGANRNKGLSRFMKKTKDSVLLMIDRDMVPSSTNDLIDICLAALSTDSIVSVVASKRKLREGIVGKRAEQKPVELGTDELQQATIAGTGIMAIPRTVIERIQDKAESYCLEPRRDVDINEYHMGVRRCVNRELGWYHDWFGQMQVYKPDHGWMELGEDVSFCMRMHHWGERIFITDKYNIGHVGEYIFYPKDGLRDD